MNNDLVVDLLNVIKSQHAQIEQLLAINGHQMQMTNELLKTMTTSSQQAVEFASSKIDIFMLCKPGDAFAESLQRVMDENGLEIRSCLFDGHQFIARSGSPDKFCKERGEKCRYDYHNAYSKVDKQLKEK